MNTKEMANYCLGCIKEPCKTGCPLNNNTKDFIKLIKEDKPKEAYELLSETTVLQSICGRICPHTKQCEGKCIRGFKGEPVKIGNLESYIGDLAIQNNWSIKKNNNELKKEKIAIIGSGPSSLTCAAFLAKENYQVTIYEKHNYLGGLLIHGIPEFRLPKNIVKETINKILSLGIEVKLNQELGKNLNIEELLTNYDAIYIGIGANKSSHMNIKGESLKGVFGANEILENANLEEFSNKNIIINGGGNVAMDAARSLKRAGANKVTIIYRRSEEELPAELKEIAEVRNDNIEIQFLTNILEIEGEEKLEKIKCIKTELVEQENSTRKVPVNIEGSEFYLECDNLVIAIGSEPEKEIINNLNIEKDSKNYLITNNYNQTSNKKIFAGGDIAGTKKTVAFAARSGRDAATNIIKYLKGEI